MANAPTHENWYVLDDATLIGKFIEDDWNISPRILVKPIIRYEPDKDNDTFNYSTGGILCNITSDDERNDPRGIGFDGYNYERKINIRLRCMSKAKLITAQDEIDRIMSRHAIRPSKNWHLLEKSGSSPMYPFRKFFQLDLTYTLKCYWKPRHNPSAQSSHRTNVLTAYRPSSRYGSFASTSISLIVFPFSVRTEICWLHLDSH